MTVPLGQYPDPTHVVAHLSDPHLLAAGQLQYGVVDPEAGLVAALERLGRVDPPPQVLVFTGDLTDLGEPDAYRALRAAVEPIAEALEAPLIWVAGNHDERGPMRQHLLDLDPTEEPVTSVTDLGGLRIIALDSSVPGWHHGELDAGQLAWLAEILAEPAPLGTLLALHHPPLPCHLPVFDILELRDQPALAAVIAGTDVRGILAGHLHYSTSGTFAGVPVSVAAATCYTMDISRPAVEVNGMDAGQSFHLTHVYADTVTHSVVPVVEAPSGDFFSQQWVDRMAALSPHERLEAFSRKR